MKTSRKIEVTSWREGAEFYGKVPHLDSVELTDIDEFLQFKTNRDECRRMIEAGYDPDELDYEQIIPVSVCYAPIVREGAFILHYPQGDGILIFESEPEADEVKVRAHVITLKRKPIWDYSISFAVPLFAGEHIQLRVFDYADPAGVVWSENGKTEDEIEEYIESRMNLNDLGAVNSFIKTMCWFNYLLANPKLKEVERESTPRSVTSSTGDRYNGRRVIHLNGIKISTDSKKVSAALATKSTVEPTACWSVRGHFRHYSDGRIVYVRPYEKGRGRKLPKTYR